MKQYALLLFIALMSSTLIGNTSINETTETPTQKTYSAQQTNSGDEFFQELSVNWISKDVIEYTFTIRNQTCSSTYRGKANINKNEIEGADKSQESKDLQIIVKNKGKSFSATEYIEKNKDFRISIQIDSADKNKAVVHFSTFLKDEDQKECRSQNVVMAER